MSAAGVERTRHRQGLRACGDPSAARMARARGWGLRSADSAASCTTGTPRRAVPRSGGATIAARTRRTGRWVDTPMRLAPGLVSSRVMRTKVRAYLTQGYYCCRRLRCRCAWRSYSAESRLPSVFRTAANVPTPARIASPGVPHPRMTHPLPTTVAAKNASGVLAIAP